MNQHDFQMLSQLRIQEAKALLDAGHFAGSYCLAGYSVECALKAVIARATRRFDFPDKAKVDACYTHNLRTLLKHAELSGPLAAAMDENQALRENWEIVQRWDEQSRYRWSVSAWKARCMYLACVQERGMLKWIGAHG